MTRVRSPEALVELDDLSVHYGRSPALVGVDLVVREGEIFGLLGPNGAGKTTALGVLLGLVRATSGSARLVGCDSTRLGPAEKARIGFVDEAQDLPDDMSLDRLVRQLRPLYPNWDDAFYDELCERFALNRRRPLGRMSRGQKVRSRLVLALAYRPAILIMDEPFGGLDPMVRSDVVDGILELTEQERWTVLLASHEMAAVERLADRVAFLSEGRVGLVEDLETLRQRCRRVSMTLSSPWKGGGSWPETWSRPRLAGLRLRFVDWGASAPDSVELAATYEEHFEGLDHLDVAEPTLEEIFVAHHVDPPLGGAVEGRVR